MSAIVPVQPSALRALCETAARALRCSVSVSIEPTLPGEGWSFAFDPESGSGIAAPGAAASHDGELRVPFPVEAGDGVLRFRGDAGKEWSVSERALAESFAPLAAFIASQQREDRLRARLAELERHVDEIQAIATLGSYEWNLVDDRITWSPEQLRIHGLDTGGEFNGGFGDFLALVHPEDRATVAALTDEMLRVGHAEAGYRIVRMDGEVRRLHSRCRVIRDDAGQPVRVMGTAQDVTQLLAIEDELRAMNERLEQRVAERTAALAAANEEVRHREEHFRRLIENGNDLLMISAPDGTITYASPSVERLLGYRPEELIGLMPVDLVHPEDLAQVAEVVTRIAREPGTAHLAMWRIRHKDGAWRLFEAIGKTLSPDTADAGVVVNGRDVTARRAAEEALRMAKIEAERAREEAERANVAKSEFLSRMSHELRTPLNSILGFAQVLEDVEMPPEYRAGVRHIISGGRHLLNLINEVLDIARIEADKQPMSLEAVRLGAIIHEAVDMVRPLAAARGIWVAELPHPSAERYVRADRQRLAQVLLNLLSNAVKYNRPSGAVRIGCEPVIGPAGEERLRIRVEDQGAGIEPEQQGQLFTPFARLGAENSGIEGTGLGLALSQRLARAMGGELALERSGPDGSAFCVDLALAPNPLADVPALCVHTDRKPRTAHPEATLLYVEDNLANLSLVETILLPRPGWRVLPALQGGLGLELAMRHAPDIVLLDLHLPDIPGREVLRQLRAEPSTTQIPVVVISADATPRTVEALLAEGADAFLTKPLNVKEFLATVERLLAHASSRV